MFSDHERDRDIEDEHPEVEQRANESSVRHPRRTPCPPGTDAMDAIQHPMQRDEPEPDDAPAEKICQGHAKINPLFVVPVNLTQKPAGALQRHRVDDNIDQHEQRDSQNQHRWRASNGLGIDNLHIRPASPKRCAQKQGSHITRMG